MTYRRATAIPSVLAPIACAAVLAVTGALLVAPAGEAAAAGTRDTILTDLTVPVVVPGKRTMAPSVSGGPARSVAALLPARDTVRYSTIGVTWTGTPVAPEVQVRVKAQGWGQWQTLDNDDEPGSAREGTAPVYVGEATGVEVRLLTDPAAGAPKDVRVSLIDSPAVAADAGPQSMVTQSASIPGMAPQPNIVSRKGWGADESLRTINAGCATPRIDRTIKAAIVHHTAGSNSYTAAQSASIIRGIYAFHVKSRGWCDVGYNFLVDRYGTIFEGRAGGVLLPVHGAHATDWNTDTVGVSFMGDFDVATPPATMLESGARLIAWKLDGNYRNPLGRVTLAGKNINVISGHGDVMSTSCPGGRIRSLLGSFRSNVASKVGTGQTPIQQRWLALGGDTGAAGSPHEPETVVASGRLTRFTSYDIAWSSSTGAKYVLGGIRTKYRAFGGPAGSLGFPTTDEQSGAPAGSSESIFTRGRILWTRSTGARAIIGGINSAYGRLPVSQRRSLGAPTGDEAKAGVAGAHRQLFTDGGIWWSSSTSGRAVLGATATRYLAVGAETGLLGLPTADQATGPVAGSTLAAFRSGRILWGSSTGARLLFGGIGSAWASLPTSARTELGLPTSDESRTKVPGVAAQPFTGGGIWWSSVTRGHSVRGAIHDRYVSLGAESSYLGLPTGEASAVSGGGLRQSFQGGTLTASATGVVTAAGR